MGNHQYGNPLISQLALISSQIITAVSQFLEQARRGIAWTSNAMTTRLPGELYVGSTFVVKNSPLAGSVARGVIRAAEKRRAQSRFYVKANQELLIPGCTRMIHAKCSTAKMCAALTMKRRTKSLPPPLLPSERNVDRTRPGEDAAAIWDVQRGTEGTVESCRAARVGIWLTPHKKKPPAEMTGGFLTTRAAPLGSQHRLLVSG
jgi:hypothetical protein